MNLVEDITLYRLYIPRAGKMFMSNISKDNQVLVYCLNKGYFETDTLDDMKYILTECENNSSGDNFKLVGDIQKVDIEYVGQVYRQRVFFKSLKEILTVCSMNMVQVIFPLNFHIDINNVMNVLDYLPALEKYAYEQDGETIEEFLTNSFKIMINELLKHFNIHSQYKEEVERFLENKDLFTYINRAPYILSSYNIDQHTSAIFQIFRKDSTNNMQGFTKLNLEADKKQGRL